MIPPPDPAGLRGLCDGFRGRFFYDVERGDLGFVASKCERKECDCEPSYNADGDIDCSVCIGDMDHGADTGEPIAQMLNAIPGLLDEVERLRMDRDSYANSGFEAQLSAAYREIAALRTALNEACNIADSHIEAKWPGARERIASLRTKGGDASWQSYIESVSVPFPIPIRIGVEDDGGIPLVFVELTVRDHETGETITVKTRRHVQPLGMLTDIEAAGVVRDLVRVAMCHEIDEAVTVDGERPFNPHKQIRSATAEEGIR
jgi:hypothetical protein